MTQPDTLRPRSCPACRSIGTPRDGCQNLWHIEIRPVVVSAPLISAAEGKIPQPEPENLHDRIRGEIDRRLAVARAATPGPWIITDPNEGSGHLSFWMIVNDAFLNPTGDEDAPSLEVEIHTGAREDAEHIALHDPADAVRRYEGELTVLDWHIPWDVDAYRYGITCKGCPNSAVNWPCFEIKALAHRLGVSVDG